jgi:hypothetical protein
MSDIGLEFPLWVAFAIFGFQYWYVFAPAALAFAGAGWFGRSPPMVFRVAAWSIAGACALPFALLLLLIAGDSVAPVFRAAKDRALHRTLSTSETIGTLVVPAGAVLEFTDETHRHLSSVALPNPARVAGILLEGRLEPLTESEWSGTLAHDQVIGDWPCRAGSVWFTPQGIATRCTLAEGHRLAGFDLPAGAECVHNPVTGGWEFRLSPDGPALRIAALNADLPPGGSVALAADGALRRLYVPHEARMVIKGAELFDHVILDGSALTAELAQPTEAGGITLPAGQVVRLDLSTGKIEATTRSPLVEP